MQSLKKFVAAFVANTLRPWVASLRDEMAALLPNTGIVADMNKIFSVQGLQSTHAGAREAAEASEEFSSDEESAVAQQRHAQAMRTKAVAALKRMVQYFTAHRKAPSAIPAKFGHLGADDTVRFA
jgi:hypothetical protein